MKEQAGPNKDKEARKEQAGINFTVPAFPLLFPLLVLFIDPALANYDPAFLSPSHPTYTMHIAAIPL